MNMRAECSLSLLPQVSATRGRIHAVSLNRVANLVNTLIRRPVGPVPPCEEKPPASGRDLAELVSVGRLALYWHYVG